MHIIYAGITNCGSFREENQDVLVANGCIAGRSGELLQGRLAGAAIDKALPVFSVVDGMGGYAGGRDAAGLTAFRVAGLADNMNDTTWSHWLGALSKDISLAGSAWNKPKMGAALALLCFTQEGVVSVNVGDCRSYRLVGDIFVQISTDDRSVLPSSSALTQVLGGMSVEQSRDMAELDPHYKLLHYAAMPDSKERYLICSDGLHGFVDDQAIKRQMLSDLPLSNICENLTASAKAARSQDNYTFAVIEVSFTDESPEEEQTLPLSHKKVSETALRMKLS
jgi:serine/threonine protein phosphatase PrpC